MKKIENLNVRFELSNDEYINPQFTKGRCKIAYAGKNRNGSNIGKEVFEKALPSLKNIPVVGYYDEESGQFTSHIGKMEMKDGEFKIYYPTPVGVVPESCNPKWETVFEEDGSINEYLACDVLLWTGRWGEILEAYQNGNGFRQSMEIEVNHWSDIDDGTLRIEELIFSSLCILQSAEPCFESSNIELFSLNKDKFKQEFKLLLEEIKNTSEKEGDSVSTEKELEVVGEITDTTVENEVNEENIDNVGEEVENENTTIESEEFEEEKSRSDEQEEVQSEVAGGETETKVESDFSLSHRDLYEKLRESISELYRDSYVWINDVYDEYAIYTVESCYCHDYKEESFKINYTKNEESEIVIDFENKVEIVKEWILVEESDKYKELLDKYTLAEEKLSKLENEKSEFEAKVLELEKTNNELYSFKEDLLEKERISKINEIESKFAKKLDINEVICVKTKAINKEISVQDMENELCKIFTNKSFEVDGLEIDGKPLQQLFSVKKEEEKCPYPTLQQFFKK